MAIVTNHDGTTLAAESEVRCLHARMDSRQERLVAVLRDARGLLARPDNDFVWSSWDDAQAAIREIDGLISQIESGDLPGRSAIEVLFLPTGPIQEVSVSSGWGQEFIELAKRFDSAFESLYRREAKK